MVPHHKVKATSFLEALEKGSTLELEPV